MKTAALSLAAISLIQLVSAQPHRRHAHQHEKKAVVTVTQIKIAEATAAPNVIVLVDQFGNVIDTQTQSFAAAPAPSTTSTTSTTTSTTSTTTSTTSTTSTTPTSTSTSTTTSTTSIPSPPPAPATTAPASPQVQQQQTSHSGGLIGDLVGAVSSAVAPIVSAVASPPSASGNGIAYNAYNSDGTCKTQTQVTLDFVSLAPYGYVRNYGVDCNQVSMMLSACKATGKKLFQGIFDLNNIEGQVSTIVSAANGDWSTFHTISVGNELVNSGQADAESVMAAVSQARTLLRKAGYNGPVVTVDTLIATKSHPVLCDKSDYCAVNCHPFFDPNTPASNAGPFLTGSISELRAKLADSNQKIIITETGWPSRGDANSQAIPSLANQVTAIASIEAAFASHPQDVIFLSAFNMLYKTSNAAQFDAEPWWGILGNCPSG